MDRGSPTIHRLNPRSSQAMMKTNPFALGDYQSLILLHDPRLYAVIAGVYGVSEAASTQIVL